MMAFMGIFYAGMGAGQAAVIMGDTAKAKARHRHMGWLQVVFYLFPVASSS